MYQIKTLYIFFYKIKFYIIKNWNCFNKILQYFI